LNIPKHNEGFARGAIVRLLTERFGARASSRRSVLDPTAWHAILILIVGRRRYLSQFFRAWAVYPPRELRLAYGRLVAILGMQRSVAARILAGVYGENRKRLFLQRLVNDELHAMQHVAGGGKTPYKKPSMIKNDTAQFELNALGVMFISFSTCVNES